MNSSRTFIITCLTAHYLHELLHKVRSSISPIHMQIELPDNAFVFCVTSVMLFNSLFFLDYTVCVFCALNV